MCDAADVIQKDGIEFLLPNVVAGADVLAFLLVGGTHEIVLHRIHGVRPVQHHRAAAVHTVDQSREDILFCHVRSAPFVLSDVLHDLPGLLRNQCFMGVLEAELL